MAGGGVGHGWVVRLKVAKTPFWTPHEHPKCPHNDQRHTSGPHTQWEQTQFPTAQLAPSMGAIVPAMTLEGWQNAFEKSRPVNIKYTGDGKILRVSVSCGNKNVFSFGADYAGFC